MTEVGSEHLEDDGGSTLNEAHNQNSRKRKKHDPIEDAIVKLANIENEKKDEIDNFVIYRQFLKRCLEQRLHVWN